MLHKLQWFIHLRAHGLRKGGEGTLTLQDLTLADECVGTGQLTELKLQNFIP